MPFPLAQVFQPLITSALPLLFPIWNLLATSLLIISSNSISSKLLSVAHSLQFLVCFLSSHFPTPFYIQLLEIKVVAVKLSMGRWWLFARQSEKENWTQCKLLSAPWSKPKVLQTGNASQTLAWEKQQTWQWPLDVKTAFLPSKKEVPCNFSPHTD